MIRAKLEWGQGPNSGDHGWIPAGQPNFDPSFSGMTAAHDLIEHMRHVQGQAAITNEIQALGAMLWGRGLAGDLDSDRALANEMTYHACDVFCELDRPPRRVTKLRGTDGEMLEEWIEAAVKKARHTVIQELNHKLWDTDERRDLRQSLEWLATWLRIGVQRARRRYAGLGPGQVVSLFRAVEYAVDPLLKNDGEEGDYILVLINPRERAAKARIVRRYDE